jgi:hypothetical protein
MVQYKLYYFNIKARAEIARWLFAYAGQKYQDIRYEFSEWPQHKTESPFGQVIIL